MIALGYQAYCVTGLQKDLHIISLQGICTSEGYTGTLIYHFHDEHDSYIGINLKEYKTGWKKYKPMDRVYIKFYPNNNLPTHEVILPKKIEKDFKALTRVVRANNMANKKLTPPKKEILQYRFRLGNIGYQHVQW